MENQIYKSNQRVLNLPSCTFTLQSLEKLFEIFVAITKDAADIEANRLKKPEGKSDQELKELKDYCRSLYIVTIEVFGTRGEYSSAASTVVLQEKQLPHHVSKIVFDNSLKYNFELKKEPPNKIRLEIDFQKPRVFDFTANASLATPNASILFVAGNTETWVEGAYSKVYELLNEHRTNRNWLHVNNAYDLFLWLIIMPTAFVLLYKIDSLSQLSAKPISTVFVAAFYVYMLFAILYIFRVFFNYLRWVFPKLDLITSTKKGPSIHRAALTFFGLTILSPLIYDITKYIYLRLTK